MATILLVRHGETDWNVERRVQGQTDRPLNAAGRAQARALADRLAGEQLHAVYSSDLSRARETAELVAGRHGLDVVILPDLREKDFGSWEGLTEREIAMRFPEARPGHWGDGETAVALAERVVRALGHIAAAHHGERVLVVSHGGPIRAALRRAGSSGPLSIGNCDVVRLCLAGGRLVPAGS